MKLFSSALELFFLLLILSSFGGTVFLVYVVWHFISKFW